jgi:hypothetical protein
LLGTVLAGLAAVSRTASRRGSMKRPVR